jgi:Raf kinase inhibitor-like YbhB/YbcL family protein
MVKTMKQLTIGSPAFENKQAIPKKYTCDAEDINPPLTINGTPKETKSLVLIVEDPDAPIGLWIHWVVWNIPPTNIINENSVPGTEGLNTARNHRYGGPCPPSGTHRYFFKVYALDAELELSENSAKKDVEKAMQGHVIAQGELRGVYSRSR